MVAFADFLLWQKNPTRPSAPLPTTAPTPADQADLSNLSAHKPYDWAKSELEQGQPIKYISGKSLVIED